MKMFDPISRRLFWNWSCEKRIRRGKHYLTLDFILFILEATKRFLNLIRNETCSLISLVLVPVPVPVPVSSQEHNKRWNHFIWAATAVPWHLTRRNDEKRWEMIISVNYALDYSGQRLWMFIFWLKACATHFNYRSRPVLMRGEMPLPWNIRGHLHSAAIKLPKTN